MKKVGLNFKPLKKVNELKTYFAKSLELIKNTSSPVYEDHIRLGEARVRLVTYSGTAHHRFIQSVEHLLVSNTGSHDLEIYYVTDEGLDYPLPAPDWGNIEFVAQGYAKTLDQEDIGVFFQPWLRQIFLYSYEDRVGIYWCKTQSEIPWWETTFSFRALFHMWSRDTPYQLMHAAAIAIDNESAVLMPAPSGSGKSTTSQYLYQANYGYLGDDYVLVNVEEATVYKLYGCAKMEWLNLQERFPQLMTDCINLDQWPSQKGIFYPIANTHTAQAYKVQAILNPSLKAGKSGIFQVNGVKSVLSIAPTTLHHLPHHREVSLRKIQKLVMNNLNYTWHLPADSQEILDQFKSLTNEKIIKCSHTDLQPV